MDEFISGLPKTELHCHIEGTFEPELMLEIARRNAVALPYGSVEELKKAYQFNRLQDFLDIYYQGMRVLIHERDFFDLTRAYLDRCAAQNIRHTEIFFDPQAHVERGVSFATVVNGITAALDSARRELGISSALIMCFLRHLEQQDAFDTLDLAEPHRDRIIGVGLDSSELGHPPEKFEQVFAAARARGYHCVAHAGEEGPPEYVWGALDVLKVDRIDHGNNALKDDQLVQRLVADAVPLTVCPLSNLKLCVVDDMVHHPLKKMLELGLKATVNSDDPAYFGGYVNENYAAVTTALGLDAADLTQLARNGVTASFASDERKRELLAEIDRYVQP